MDHSKYHPNDNFNIIILWRSYGFKILGSVRANKIIIDINPINKINDNNLITANKSLYITGVN